MKHESKNDYLIEQLLEDPLYKITKDGKVYSKLTLNGQGITKDWRELGYVKADGYVRFRYKDEFLFVQRVIYRKFKGELDPTLTINHINLDHSDNHPDNLEQISQGENNKKKHKKYKKSVLARVIEKLSEEMFTRKKALDLLYSVVDKIDSLTPGYSEVKKSTEEDISNLRLIYDSPYAKSLYTYGNERFGFEFNGLRIDTGPATIEIKKV